MSKNISNLNMEYHMLYMESRKSFKVRREKNLFLCRVPNKYTRQTHFFAECQIITLGKHISLPSVSTKGHSANVLTDGTRTNGCPRGGSLPSA